MSLCPSLLQIPPVHLPHIVTSWSLCGRKALGERGWNLSGCTLITTCHCRRDLLPPTLLPCLLSTCFSTSTNFLQFSEKISVKDICNLCNRCAKDVQHTTVQCNCSSAYVALLHCSFLATSVVVLFDCCTDLLHHHQKHQNDHQNNTSKTDLAPWCYKSDGWMDGRVR